MNITVTYKDSDNEGIVQIDPRQEIGAGLRILKETGKFPNSPAPDFLRSSGLEKVVSAHMSFNELGIYSGDVLSTVERV